MKLSPFIIMWQLLILVLISHSSALEPPCCGPSNYLVQLEINSTGCYNLTHVDTNISLICKSGSFPLLHEFSEFSATPIVKDKILTIEINKDENTIEDGGFCFGDAISDPSEVNASVPVVVLCASFAEPEDEFQQEVFSICMLVSCAFYLLTALIYSLLPQLRDVLGLCIINFCVAIGIGLLVFAILNLVPYTDEQHGHCAARGFFSYYFLITGFFWTNVISFHAFRSLNNVAKPESRRTIIWYAVYAWGVPIVLTSIVAIVNYHPGNHARPGIALNTCWFLDLKQRWIYFYSVMAILFVFNLMCFARIIFVLWGSAKWQRSTAREIRYRFNLTMQLFFIMGIPWIFDIIKETYGDTGIVWYILDIVNMLQGVLAFMVLVALRKRALRAMHARGWFLCLGDRVDRYLRDVTDAEADVVAQTDVQDMTVMS